MKIEISVKCEFCGRHLEYVVSGDIHKEITVSVTPCKHCIDEVMGDAWRLLKEKRSDDQYMDENLT